MVLKALEKSKKGNPHSVSSVFQVRQGSLQQVDDGIIHPNAGLVCKLQGIHVWAHQGAEVPEDDPLLCLHQDLKWESNIDAIRKKAQQRMYFLHQLRKFNLPQELLMKFYTTIIQSVLCTSITMWFGSATKQDRNRLQRTVRTAEKIICASLLLPFRTLYVSRVRKQAVSTVGAIIRKWKKHHLIINRPRTGAPRKISDQGVRKMVRRVLKEPKDHPESAPERHGGSSLSWFAFDSGIESFQGRREKTMTTIAFLSNQWFLGVSCSAAMGDRIPLQLTGQNKS
ncbi:hypothetical protein L3Q82_004448 [Scortum barcoo]|uniref:Uncharacterized protein n=1 Tax=Scortum barcoo TaxID=214431 RepID=A0ACB8VKE8_9TELE|nr:hypothetical protein L3Q82_004448 [Scortum barcoo]